MNTTTKANLAGLLGYGIFGFSFLFSKLVLGVPRLLPCCPRGFSPRFSS